MRYDDDEPIAPPDSAGETITGLPGKVMVKPILNEKAPLSQNIQSVMLELTGGESSFRPGLDLVVVLDTSESMKGTKLEAMKTAVKFVIKKLSTVDRMCVVAFSEDAHRLCPLRQITKASQEELQSLVDSLDALGRTNIKDGLETGLKVLADRRITGSRDIGIMLMSDGKQNRGGDAAEVTIGEVPVYTFGYGERHDPKVLYEVARNSSGGTFSVVLDTGDLSLAFSQCLAGLLTVIVQDLTLTMAAIEDQSAIQNVTAGSYPKKQGANTDSVTITFNDLYNREVRTVIVDLLLPDVKDEVTIEILEVSHTYSHAGKIFEAPPQIVDIKRTDTADQEGVDPPEVEAEMARVNTVGMIVEARTLADGKNVDDALDKLVEAQDALEDIIQHSSPMINMLKTDLQQLIEVVRTPELYNKKGRAYALSSEISHNRRRFAARGNIENMRLFATPRMNTYLEQAINFNNNPTMPLPSVDDDIKQEINANPIAPIAGTITYYIQVAIQALRAIEKVLGSNA